MSQPVSRRWFIIKLVVLGLFFLLRPILNVILPLIASHRPVVRHVDIMLPNLPPELEGLTMVHISDLHYGFGLFSDMKAVDDIKNLVHSLHPELIVFTGDLLDQSSDPELAKTPILSGLHAPLGVYAVLGNHDRVFSERALKSAFSEAGVQLLINESVYLKRNGRAFRMVGLDDPMRGTPRLDKAMVLAPEKATSDSATNPFTILLVHAPDYAPEAARHHIPLQLSGHSHCGQIRLPGLGALLLPPLGKTYPSGLQRVLETQTFVYTNCGLGTSGLPFRVFCPPEVTKITLRTEV